MSNSVLLIEDDKQLSKLLVLDLELNSYKVFTAENGVEGLRRFSETQPDVVVLDISLPLMNGIMVCQRIREISDVPILLMTANDVTEEDIAEGLNIGADEFMLKPLPHIEFHARIRALLRRAKLLEPNVKEQATRYEDDNLFVDLNTRRVRIKGQEVRLTPTEFKLLAMFIQHRGEVLSFQKLLESVWGPEYKNEHHYPRIYVSHLRRKIEPDLKYPLYIHNEYGIGYRFVGQNAE